MSRALDITTPDGTIDAFIFTPDDASGPLPAVVLLTDIGGIRGCYHDKAQTIADDGYAVLMPNIYHRDGAGSPVPEGKAFHDDDVLPELFALTKKLTPDAQKQDSTAYLTTIDAEPEFADAVVWIIANNEPELFKWRDTNSSSPSPVKEMIMHYIDDFFGGHQQKATAKKQFEAVKEWWIRLGIPTQDRKCTPPTQILRYLGFLFNAAYIGGVAMAIYVPLLLFCNHRYLPKSAKPGPFCTTMMAVASFVYIAFAGDGI